ncbi:hypothetical protein LY78DRAFT_476617 [Colletotrichum sublineola]|nr:hypothetical protein LY78DRAFT_476617 [Colletotrichum sublineola]
MLTGARLFLFFPCRCSACRMEYRPEIPPAHCSDIVLSRLFYLLSIPPSFRSMFTLGGGVVRGEASLPPLTRPSLSSLGTSPPCKPRSDRREGGRSRLELPGGQFSAAETAGRGAARKGGRGASTAEWGGKYLRRGLLSTE